MSFPPQDKLTRGEPKGSLVTQRVRLRQWRSSDKPLFAALNADPVVMAHFPAALNREESDGLADRCTAEIESQGWGFWAAEHVASGTFMGMVGLHQVHASLPFAPAVEVGWRLARQWWGQGLATEAAHAALAFGFDVLGLDEVVSFAARSNARSQAVMLRLSMQADGSFVHPLLPEQSPLRTHVLYRLTRMEWQSRDSRRQCPNGDPDSNGP